MHLARALKCFLTASYRYTITTIDILIFRITVLVASIQKVIEHWLRKK